MSNVNTIDTRQKRLDRPTTSIGQVLRPRRILSTCIAESADGGTRALFGALCRHRHLWSIPTIPVVSWESRKMTVFRDASGGDFGDSCPRRSHRPSSSTSWHAGSIVQGRAFACDTCSRSRRDRNSGSLAPLGIDERTAGTAQASIGAWITAESYGKRPAMSACPVQFAMSACCDRRRGWQSPSHRT
jgi:hypothetical protein